MTLKVFYLLGFFRVDYHAAPCSPPPLQSITHELNARASAKTVLATFERSNVRKIEIVNVRGMKARTPGVVYIGRACAGWKQSALANPFVLGKDGDRKEAIERYRHWLWREIQMQGNAYRELMRLAGIYAEGGKIVLGCWCFPQTCHGEVIARAIRYYGYFKRSTRSKPEPRKRTQIEQANPKWLAKFQIVTKGGDPHS